MLTAGELCKNGDSAILTQSCTTTLANIKEDILIQIFLALAEDINYIKKEGKWRIWERWDWICVREVCRRWDTVVTRTPILWSCFHTFDSTKRTKTSLVLSKDSDLTVHYSESRETDEKCSFCNLKTVLGEMRRIRYISIHVLYYRSEIKEIYALLRQPMPRTKTIKLYLEPYEDYPTPSKICLPFTSSNLKQVEIHRLNLDWKSFRICGLSSLHIGFCKDISLSDLFGALEACRELTSLFLDCCSFEQSSLQSTVHLPCLLDLILEFQQISPIFVVLGSLDAPNLLRWKVHCEENLATDDIKNLYLLSKLLRREYGIENMKFGTLFKPGKSPIDVKIQSSYRDSGKADLKLQFDQVHLNRIMSSLIEVFNSQLRIAEDLDIGLPDDEISLDTWHSLYCAAAFTKCVNASTGSRGNHRDGINYLEAFALARPRQTIHSSEGAPCPNLEKLNILWFGKNANLDDFLSALEEMLKARSNLESPIRNLTIDSYFVARNDEKLKILAPWITDLKWRVWI